MGFIKDITGQRFGRLVALRPTEERHNGAVVWECRCDCGNTKRASQGDLSYGAIKSCDCLANETREINSKKYYKNIKGEKFFNLTAIEKSKNRNNQNRELWIFLCDCGEKKELEKNTVTSGHTKSCGCLSRKAASERIKRIPLKKRMKNLNADCIDGTKKSLLTQKLGIRNKTGVKGVCKINRTGLYVAQIGFKGKNYCLGYSHSLEEATKMRKQAEEMLFEPFIEWYNENFKKPGRS